MPLLKDGKQVADTWTTVEAIEEVNDGEPVIVPLEVWRAHREALLKRNAPLGIRLNSDQPPAEIADDLRRFDVVALNFPKFTDGRAYSHARLLRQRYGFTGELRAVGQVLRDQALFMVRCGFDAFEVADQATADAWADALARIRVIYQPAADGSVPAPWLRRRRQAAE